MSIAAFAATRSGRRDLVRTMLIANALGAVIALACAGIAAVASLQLIEVEREIGASQAAWLQIAVASDELMIDARIYADYDEAAGRSTIARRLIASRQDLEADVHMRPRPASLTSLAGPGETRGRLSAAKRNAEAAARRLLALSADILAEVPGSAAADKAFGRLHHSHAATALPAWRSVGDALSQAGAGASTELRLIQIGAFLVLVIAFAAHLVFLGRPALKRLARALHALAVSEARAREAAAKAERADAARAAMITDVSHEIRNPLSGVVAMAEEMRAEARNAAERARAAALADAGGAVMALLDDVLDAARLESGRLALALEPFDPAAAVRETIAILEPRGRALGRTIAFEDRRAALGLVGGDRRRLRQILMNLLTNALKHARAQISVTLSSAADGALVLTVADDGPGVPDGLRTRLFQRFAQGSSEIGRRGTSGLGLAITAELVRLMNGRIEIGRAASGGAEFAAVLPLEPAGVSTPAGRTG